MARTVIPHVFSLFAGLQEEAQKFRLNEKVIEEFYRDGTDHSGLPVALRWSHHPSLGIPRQPFQVWRRIPSIFLVNIASPTFVSGERFIEWDRRGMIRVEFRAVPNTGSSLTVFAVDWNNEIIPGQTIFFNSTRRGRFYGPGICGIKAVGSGLITDINGLDQDVYANDDGWRRIELVGLPVRDEIDIPDYAPHPQGPEPASLSGAEAGIRRLDIARLMHLTPPISGVVGVPTPDWPPPETMEYLFGSGDGLGQMLNRIYECLANTSDDDPAHQQVNFLNENKVPGVQQVEGGPAGTDPAFVNLPVIASAILAAASETYAATGLGYGTIDFPFTAQPQQPTEVIVPDGTVLSAFDYMVTALFVTAFELPFIGKVVIKHDLAALAQLRHNPEPPQALNIKLLHRNRAEVLDGPESQAVRLRWRLSSQPQSYAAFRSRAPGQVEVLNAPRLKSGGFEPYMPERPAPVDGQISPAERSNMIDPHLPVPITGSQQVRYFVAGLDVFGRWTNWENVQLTVSAPPVRQPGLHGITLLPEKTPIIDRTVPATLEIVFSWDWFERRLERVVFRGRFFQPNAIPIPGEPTGFRLREGGLPGPQVEVSFDSITLLPSITSPHPGTIEQVQADPPPVPPPPNTNSLVRQYRLTLTGLEVDFSDDPEAAFMVYIRASERAQPLLLSDPVGPAVAKAFDPIPPESISLPADVQWTALPDASGIARRVIEWPSVPNVKGYVVWQATETALLQRINPNLPPPPPGSSLQDRATIIRDLMVGTENQNKAAIAFTRLNTELISGTNYEVELPGAADVIYVYQVTAVSLSNETSPRSNSLTFVAVPRLNQPGQPRAQVRRLEDSSGLRISVIPGRGPQPAGYRVFRARNPLLVQEVGLMGPPKINLDDPGWEDVDLPAPDGGTPIAGQAIADLVPPSWYPYFYRVIALGEQDLPEGQVRGQSLPSTTQEAFIPPPNPPVLDEVTEVEAFDQIASIAVNLRPVGIVFDPRRGRLYCTNQFSNSLSIINADSDTVIATVPVGARPSAVATLPASNLIYTANSAANTITFINAVTRATRAVAIGGRPSALAVNTATRRLYVTIPTFNRVVTINAVSGGLIGSINMIARPSAVAVHQTLNRIYVASSTLNTMTVINGATNTVMATLPVGGRAVSIDVNPLTKRIYVANQTSSSLVVFHDSTHTRLAEISLGQVPTQVRVDIRTNKIYVSHSAEDSITVIDGGSNTITDQISISKRPTGLAVHPMLERVYITQQIGNSVAVFSLTRGGNNRVFQLRTDLPVKQTSLGEARFDLTSLKINSSGQVERNQLLSIAPFDVTEGPPLTVLSPATPEQLAVMPEVTRGPTDSQGRAVYTVRVRSADIEGNVMVTVRDPLKRVTEVQVPEVPA